MQWTGGGGRGKERRSGIFLKVPAETLPAGRFFVLKHIEQKYGQMGGGPFL